MSCSCIHTSSGRLLSSVWVSQPMPPGVLAAGGPVGGRLGLQRRVARRDGLLDLVGQRLHVAVAASEHTLLGVVVHQALQVRRLADLDRLLGGAGEHGLEVRGVRHVVLDAPAVEVGRQVPLLPRDLAGEGHEVGARAVPELDQLDTVGGRRGCGSGTSVMAHSVRRPACPWIGSAARRAAGHCSLCRLRSTRRSSTTRVWTAALAVHHQGQHDGEHPHDDQDPSQGVGRHRRHRRWRAG